MSLVVELRPDRGGLVGEDITCSGRDERGCVDVDKRSPREENRRQTERGHCRRRGVIDADFTDGSGKGGSDLADGTGPWQILVVAAMESQGNDG